MTNKGMRKAIKDYLADKPDKIVDRCIITLGRKYVLSLSLYDGSKTQRYDIADWHDVYISGKMQAYELQPI